MTKTCSCSISGLDSHGLSEARQAEICTVLNGIDNDIFQGLYAGDEGRNKKLDYARSLKGEEQLYAFHWIRYQ